MHICVIGAGVVGLTTAYFLQSEGHAVTVVDREPGPGLGASGGNGAQLSYAFVAPLADASIPAKLPGLLLSRHAPLKIHPRADLRAGSLGPAVPEAGEHEGGARHHRGVAEARGTVARVHRAADRGRAHRVRLHARREARGVSGHGVARRGARAGGLPGGARHPRPGGADAGAVRRARARDRRLRREDRGRCVDPDRSRRRLRRVLRAGGGAAGAARGRVRLWADGDAHRPRGRPGPRADQRGRADAGRRLRPGRGRPARRSSDRLRGIDLPILAVEGILDHRAPGTGRRPAARFDHRHPPQDRVRAARATACGWRASSRSATTTARSRRAGSARCSTRRARCSATT